MDAPSAHVRHRGPPREPPPDVKANVKPRRERKSSLDAALYVHPANCRAGDDG